MRRGGVAVVVEEADAAPGQTATDAEQRRPEEKRSAQATQRASGRVTAKTTATNLRAGPGRGGRKGKGSKWTLARLPAPSLAEVVAFSSNGRPRRATRRKGEGSSADASLSIAQQARKNRTGASSCPRAESECVLYWMCRTEQQDSLRFLQRSDRSDGGPGASFIFASAGATRPLAARWN